MNNVSNYASYLVRLWLEDEDKLPADRAIWHAEVESIQSGESWHFTDAATLVEFLQQRVLSS